MSSAYCDTLLCLSAEPGTWIPLVHLSQWMAWPSVSATMQYSSGESGRALSNPTLKLKRQKASHY